MGFSAFFDTSTGGPGSGAYAPPLNVDVPDGDDQAIRAGRLPPSNAIGGTSVNQVGLMYWNTNSLPLGSTVTGASISFEVLSTAGSVTTYPIFPTIGAWSEAQLNAAMLGDPPGSTLVVGSGTILANPGQGAVTVGSATFTGAGTFSFGSSAALDAEIQRWIAQPGANFGLQIHSSNYTNPAPRGAQIASREHATLNGPGITFTWTAPQFYFTGDQDAVLDTNNVGNTNWATDVTGATDTAAVPGSGNNVVLAANNANTGNLNTTLAAPMSLNGVFLTGTVGTSNSVTIGGANTLTLGAGGLTTDAGQASHTISAPVAIGASQTWDNEGANTLNVTNTVSLGANTLTLAGSGPINISGVISGTGGLTAKGTGVVTLNSSNTYTGVTSILGGTLNVAMLANGGSVSDIGQSSSAAANLAMYNGKLRYTGSTVTTNRAFTLTNHGVNTIEVTNAATTLDFDGAMNGLGFLVKTGAGTLELSANAVSRAATSGTSQTWTVIEGGVLRIKTANALGTGSANDYTFIDVYNTGVLEISGAAVALQGGFRVNLFNGSTIRSDGSNTTNASVRPATTGTVDVTVATTNASDTFTVGNNANDVTSGSATSTIHVAGPGTVLLTQASNYAGNWSLDNGTTLLQTTNTVLGATSARTLTLNGGTLRANYTAGQSFTGGAGNNVVVAANSSVTSDRTTLGSGFTYTFGNLSVGATTLNVTGGANVNAGTAGTTFGATTLTGNATFNVTNPAGGGATLLTLGAIGQTGGARSLTKTGNGQATITGISSYTGNTLVSGGTLALSHGSSNNVIATSQVIEVGSGATLDVTGLAGTLDLVLASGQTLKGTGTVLGNLTIAAGSTLSPGNSPETTGQVGNQIWEALGGYDWEIDDVLGAMGGDPGWDLMDITGTLDITATTASKFTIDILSLAHPSHALGNAANFLDSQDYVWTIVATTGGVTWDNVGAFADHFTLIDNFANFHTGTFSIALNGSNGIDLLYTAAEVELDLLTPEPSMFALAALACTSFCGIIPRRRRRTC